MAFMDSMRFVEIIRDDGGILSATQEDVLAGSIFVGKAKIFQTGNIPILQSFSNISLACDESFVVPYGHIKKEFTITAVSLADQTPGNAGEADLLINKISWSNGILLNGSMPNHGAVLKILSAGESFNIDLGYHNGNGRITVKTLAEQTPGTAISGNLLIGTIAWVNGIEIIGTMTNNQNISVDLEAGRSYTIPEGYHPGTGKIRAISLAEQTQGTATADDIVLNKTAWVDGILVTGKIPKIASKEIILPLNGTYTIPYGIQSGLSTVTQKINTLAGLTITPTFKNQTVNVKDKYMLSDITVTGINAMNYDFNKTVIYDQTINLQSTAKLDKLLIKIPVDNWHDNKTMNIYGITIWNRISSTSSKEMLFDTFIHYFNAPANTWIVSSRLSNDYPGVIMRLDMHTDSDNGHLFRLVVDPQSTIVQSINLNIDIKITETHKFRQFGDDHDV